MRQPQFLHCEQDEVLGSDVEVFAMEIDIICDLDRNMVISQATDSGIHQPALSNDTLTSEPRKIWHQAEPDEKDQKATCSQQESLEKLEDVCEGHLVF